MESVMDVGGKGKIVLDFDGVCVPHEYQKIGKDIGPSRSSKSLWRRVIG
jgi:hypothetical protein